MTTQTTPILDLLRKFVQAIKAFRMYGGDHPQTQEYLKTLGMVVKSYLAGELNLKMVFHGNTLIVQEVVQPNRDPAISFLADSLGNRFITSLEFHPGVYYEEIFEVVRILAVKPDEVVQANDLKVSLQQRFKNVSFNKIRYVAVNESQEVVVASDAGGAPVQDEPLTRSIEGLNRALERAGFSGEDQPEGAASQPETSSSSERHPGKSPVPRATPELINFVAERVVPGMSPAWEQLARILAQMSKSVRFRLEHVERTALPAAIVARQLQSGFDPEVVQKTFSELAPERREALVLFDALAKVIHESGKTFSGESLKKLIRFLPQLNEMPEARRGRVLVVEGDSERSAALEGVLADLAYDVDIASTVKEAIDKISSVQDYAAMVLRVELPDKRGTVVLSHLQTSAAVIPAVIVGEKVSTDACDFEIFSYPKKKIVQSDNPTIIARAVGECVKKISPLAEKARKEDEEHAREVQGKLIPADLPQLAGWELELLHQPAKEVGGDFVDIFKVDKDRLGILFGEVSERGTSAAVAIVMMRSAFRLSVSVDLSPAELVSRVNRLVAADLRPGVTISLLYACVQFSNGRVSLVNCGQNQPILYDARDRSVQIPPAQGLPIGLMAVEKFEGSLKQEDLIMFPGDHLVFYTDGVTETFNELAEPFRVERFREVVKREGSGASLRLLKILEAEIAAHRGSALPSRSEDLTFLALRRAPEA